MNLKMLSDPVISLWEISTKLETGNVENTILKEFPFKLFGKEWISGDLYMYSSMCS